MKIVTICGTRPELIRLSEIIKKLDEHTHHIFVHTNQNYDYELNQVFFDELRIRKPDYVLNVRSGTVGEQIGQILIQCEKVLLREKPDAVLILGDTNSALSCIVAKRLKIIVFHIEAGNRCFDENVPEEINRRIVDHTSDINMCYSEHARRNLLREGIAPQDIFVTGSPLPEVYRTHKESIEGSRVLDTLHLVRQGYFLASIHREENVDDAGRLCAIRHALCSLAEKYTKLVILSTHPRTRKRLSTLDLNLDGVLVHPPFGMFDYIKLQRNAFCNISDSGTIHEDAAIFGIPAVTIRESNERPEAYDAGNVIVTRADTNSVLEAVRVARDQFDSGVRFRNPYRDEDCSDKIVRLIIGYHGVTRRKRYYLA